MLLFIGKVLQFAILEPMLCWHDYVTDRTCAVMDVIEAGLARCFGLFIGPRPGGWTAADVSELRPSWLYTLLWHIVMSPVCLLGELVAMLPLLLCFVVLAVVGRWLSWSLVSSLVAFL